MLFWLPARSPRMVHDGKLEFVTIGSQAAVDKLGEVSGAGAPETTFFCFDGRRRAA